MGGFAVSRIKDLQKEVHRILKCMDENQKRAGAIAHLHGVSLAAVMIAKKRGEDPELAAMAGLLHDMYAYKSGSYDDHARLGAEYARQILNEPRNHFRGRDQYHLLCNCASRQQG